ncbi:C39 family peptidase [candidate division KSB1 bacterium]|nr:C39 family peptidase [candidate division KSB1 bacterium]
MNRRTHSLLLTLIALFSPLKGLSRPAEQPAISEMQAIHFSLAQALQLLPDCSRESAQTFWGYDDKAFAYSLTYHDQKGERLNLLVSADPERHPLIRYTYQDDPEYQKMDVFLDQARAFVWDPQHSRTYYFGLGECWHLFCNDSDSIYICTRLDAEPLMPEQFRAHKHHLSRHKNVSVGESADAQEVAQQWQRLQNGTLVNPQAIHWIPNRNDVPDFDWHYGCTPTAAANLLGYYDIVYGYGNMLSYFFRENDSVQGGIDETIPSLSTWLKDLMGTNANGATVDASLGEHIAQAATMMDPSYVATDYGLNITTPWQRLTEEIDAGYPCVFSADMPGAEIVWHSMTAVGYGDNPDQVAVYDINHNGISYYTRSELSPANVAWVHLPLVNRANGITLTGLRGANSQAVASDVLRTHENYTLTWSCDRPGDGKVDIEFNKSGGVGSWQTLVSLNSNPGQWVWLPGDEHVGDMNRLRIRWRSPDNAIWGSDGSLSNFTVTAGHLNSLSNGVSIESLWPDASSCTYTDNQWAIVAIYQENINVDNTLQLYPDTTFQNVAANDQVGKSNGRRWGLCGVNVGPPNPPPGPFGVQIVGDGQGRIQFVESKELLWGTGANYEYWGTNQIVKAHHFYIDPQDKILLHDTEIYLENMISADLSLYLFDTSKRFFAADDALQVIDNGLSGADEHMTLPAGASGRFLLVIRNKSNQIGNYRLSLSNETKATQLAQVPLNTPDTLSYSGLILPLSLDQAPWYVAGVMPLGNAQWELSVARDCTFVRPVVTSRWPKPYVNMVVMKKNTNPENLLYLKPKRAEGDGDAHFELNTLSDETPLRGGSNPARLWPAGKAFHIVPIVASKPLLGSVAAAVAADGREIYCGIVPDSGAALFSTSMFWGSATTLPQGNAQVKTGVVVFWVPNVPRQSFRYEFSTNDFTKVAEEPEVPKSYDLSVYPNPFTDRIVLTGLPARVTADDIEMFDLLGRRQTIAARSFGGAPSIGFVVDTRSLPVGSYFLRAGGVSGACYRIVKVR